MHRDNYGEEKKIQDIELEIILCEEILKYFKESFESYFYVNQKLYHDEK